MTIDNVTNIVYLAIQVTILASLPSCGLGLLVGLIISVFQAVTQVQEQTLTFVPKMVVVFMVIAATFPWMSNMIVNMTITFWESIPTYSQ